MRHSQYKMMSLQTCKSCNEKVALLFGGYCGECFGLDEWVACYNARKHGAIGIFYAVWVIVRAHDRAEAAQRLWDKIHLTHEVNCTRILPRLTNKIEGALDK